MVNYLAFLAIVAASLGHAASLSTSTAQHDSEETTAVPFDEQEQLVSDLVNLGNRFYLQRSQDEFGIRSHGIVEKTGSRSIFYPLPQSSLEKYKRLRGNDMRWPLSEPQRITNVRK